MGHHYMMGIICQTVWNRIKVASSCIKMDGTNPNRSLMFRRVWIHRLITEKIKTQCIEDFSYSSSSIFQAFNCYFLKRDKSKTTVFLFENNMPACIIFSCTFKNDQSKEWWRVKRTRISYVYNNSWVVVTKATCV